MPGWLAVDRQFFFLSSGRSQIRARPQEPWQSSPVSACSDQTSSLHSHRQVASETREKKQGITLVIIPMPWDVSLWIYECGFTSAHILSQEGKISGSHKWLTDLQGKRGNFIVTKQQQESKQLLSVLCKHISFALMLLCSRINTRSQPAHYLQGDFSCQ